MNNYSIEIPRRWFPDGATLRPLHKDGKVFLYEASEIPLSPCVKYAILSKKDADEADSLRAEIKELQYVLEKKMYEMEALEKKLYAKTAKPGIVAEVTRAGVCEICGDGAELIRVNEHNLVSELEKAVELLNPDCDHRGAFAARVTISVELLGDLEEEDEKDSEPD